MGFRTAGIHVAMIAKGRDGAQITDRDLRRVMAARRALHAYEPYAPTTRGGAASGTRVRSTTAPKPTSPPRTASR